eukprot:749528-Hanusia_phi.AAC.1
MGARRERPKRHWAREVGVEDGRKEISGGILAAHCTSRSTSRSGRTQSMGRGWEQEPESGDGEEGGGAVSELAIGREVQTYQSNDAGDLCLCASPNPPPSPSLAFGRACGHESLSAGVWYRR